MPTEKTIFGRTDLSVSRLGFGAAPVGLLGTPQDEIDAVVALLLDHGVNFFDTAACYAGSEVALGKALQGHRDDAVLVTKCGHRLDSDAHDHAEFSPELIATSIDRSLERLGTDHLDVVLLHTCDFDTLKKGDALGALVKAREQGKTRFVGFSGDNEPVAWAAAHPEVAVVEMSVNIVDQHNIDVALPVCRKHDVGVIAKRPVANACWKPRDKQPGMYKDYSSNYTARLKAMGVTPGQLGYSGHVEVEWPEIALKFTLAQAGVHTAICGTTSPDHTEMNLQAVAKNPLREQVVATLRDAFKQARQASGEAWPGLT